MIYIVLGMHKSGTTLVAKTLHESGVNMGVAEGGDYPKFKYEDKRVNDIKNDILYNGMKVKSYELPVSCNNKSYAIAGYIEQRQGEGNENWGIKIPDMLMCYEQWRLLLPEHTLIGIRRSYEGVLAHYMKRRNPPNEQQIKKAYQIYNNLLDIFIPHGIIDFDELLKQGPVLIEKASGLTGLKDVRRNR